MKPLKPLAIIPAQPGWFVVDIFDDKDQTWGAEIWKQPVIAWAILELPPVKDMPWLWGHPVCVESVNEEYFLLSPDGQVTDPESGSWDTVGDFIKARAEKKK